MVALPADEVLVAGLRSGDEATFARLLDSWTPAMIALARSHVSTDASAAEVVQDTWLAVIKGIGGFEGRASLKTWVFRILANTAKTRGVRESRMVPWSSLAPGEEEFAPTMDPSWFRGYDDDYPGHWRSIPAAWRAPDLAALDAEARQLLHLALQRLPQRQRVVVTLRDVEGYGADEVCTMLGLSAGNQRVLLHRGRAAVRAELAAYLAVPADDSGGGSR